MTKTKLTALYEKQSRDGENDFPPVLTSCISFMSEIPSARSEPYSRQKDMCGKHLRHGHFAAAYGTGRENTGL